MYTIETILIGINTNNQTINYLSPKPLKSGDVIKVPFKNQTYNAIVIQTTNAIKDKLAIKDIDFSLKKTISSEPITKIPEPIMKTLKDLSSKFNISPKALYESFFPKETKEALEKNAKKIPIWTPPNNTDNYKPEISILMAPRYKRIEFIASLIRAYFSKNQSIVVISNSESRLQYIYEKLKKYSMSKIHKLTSLTTKTKRKEIIQKLHTEKHSILITTPYNILLSPPNTQLIIIEDESSPDYTKHIEPSFNTKLFIEEFAQKAHIKTILSDTLVSPYAIKLLQENRAMEEVEISRRLNPRIQYSIIDLTSPKYQSEKTILGKKHHNHYILDKAFYESIDRILEKELKVFIYSPKKGGIPITTCRDCGKAITCPSCKTPLSLKQNHNNKNIYKCKRCNKKYPPPNECPHCGGVIFYYMGISTETIADEINTLHPGITTIIIDSENTPSRKKATEALEKFNKTKNAVLIATSYILNIINDNTFDISIISSLDSILLSPDIDSHWQSIRLIKQISEITTKKLIVQTRNNDETIYKTIKSKNISYFIESEMSARKIFQLPPYYTILKITTTLPISYQKEYFKFIKSHFAKFRKNSIELTQNKDNKNKFTSVIEIHIPSHEYFDMIKQPNNPSINAIRMLVNNGSIVETIC